jgi:hypothetical protein
MRDGGSHKRERERSQERQREWGTVEIFCGSGLE